MKREEITKRMAAQDRSSAAEAADRLDRVVYELIQKLRRGRKAVLPGLGDLLPRHEPPAAEDEN